MSGDEFYGPALPPGFRNVTSDVQCVEAEAVHELCDDRKRRYSSLLVSVTSSSSSHDANHPSCGQSKKEYKTSERLFGPALPEGFSTAGEKLSSTESFFGPVLPPVMASAAIALVSDNEDESGIGPSPSLNSDSKTQLTIEQIESRAQMMKDKLEGKDAFELSSSLKKREEWMVELPAEMTKNFGVTARKFSTKTTISVDKDRSVWTDTPADRVRKQQQSQESCDHKSPQSNAEEVEKVSSVNQLYREQVDEYNRLARSKSLLEMHVDKVLHKSQHKKKKKSKDREKRKKNKKSTKKERKDEEKVERRPFDRDKDLTVTRMDDVQRASVISRSKELGGRFGHGATQFL